MYIGDDAKLKQHLQKLIIVFDIKNSVEVNGASPADVDQLIKKTASEGFGDTVILWNADLVPMDVLALLTEKLERQNWPDRMKPQVIFLAKSNEKISAEIKRKFFMPDIFGENSSISGSVVDLKELTTRKGTKMAIFTLVAGTENFEAIIFPELWESVGTLVSSAFDSKAVSTVKGDFDLQEDLKYTFLVSSVEG